MFVTEDGSESITTLDPELDLIEERISAIVSDQNHPRVESPMGLFRPSTHHLSVQGS